MIRVRRAIGLAAVSVLTIAGVTAAAQQRPYPPNNQQTQDVLNRIDARTRIFRLSFDRAIDQSRIRGSREADEINRTVNDFEEATSRLRDRANDRQSEAAAIDEILRPATLINTFMTGNKLDASVQRDWQDLRKELEQLAQAHRVTWDPTGSQTTSSGVTNQPARPSLVTNRLGGTYQLDTSRGDDPRRAADQATRTLPAEQRSRAYQRLMNRLEAPDVIAIDRQGNRVSMATSRGPRVTFDADNRVRTEEAV